MFNWEGFENREFCVDFKNDADKMEFLRECASRGYKLLDTHEEYIRHTKYCISDWVNKAILFNSIIERTNTYNPHPIDCSIAENYISERLRLQESFDGEAKVLAIKAQKTNPKEAVEIVQAWSDEHPIEPVVTNQDKFLESYPNARKVCGILKVNPCGIEGLEYKKTHCSNLDSCNTCRKEYWSQPYKEDKPCGA